MPARPILLSILLSTAVQAMPAVTSTVTIIASPTSLFTGFGPIITSSTFTMTMNSDEVMSGYQSMVSSLNDKMNSQMSSASEEMDNMAWYANYAMSMITASTTADASFATVTVTV